VDYTVYSQIRFPLADAPAFATSEVYQRRNRAQAADADDTLGPTLPWRDNFCERRGFPVGQCPAGIGHQGQDIRPGPCKPLPGMDRCTHHGDIVAVRDGVILRSARQEAAYLFVNSANEHIRFRYLHMSPRKMDADNLLNGRRVHEGEIIGEVSNFSMKEAGTSYHVHFDVQVPTKYGWVFVNPYMTLVTAYERLLGERGTELADPSVVATADSSSPSSVLATTRLEPDRPSRAKRAKLSRSKAKAKAARLHAKRHRQHVARQE
jgi:murein DD-endopeptidase MepM/ murein hydrolase activator NlpD